MANATDDYEERITKWGCSTKDCIKELAASNEVVFLDTRGDEEFAAKQLNRQGVVHIPITMSDQSNIAIKAAELLPNKDIPIIVFCGVGARASKAIDALNEMGYTKLYNAGGLKDLSYLMECEA